MAKKFNCSDYFNWGFNDGFAGREISTFNCKDNKALKETITKYYMRGYNKAKSIEKKASKFKELK